LSAVLANSFFPVFFETIIPGWSLWYVGFFRNEIHIEWELPKNFGVYFLLHQHPSQGVIGFVIFMQLGSDQMGAWHNFGILTNREIINIVIPAVFCLFDRINLPHLWI